MKTVETRERSVVAELTSEELAALASALVWLRMHLHVDDYHTLLGIDKARTEELRETIANALDAVEARRSSADG
jgi:hypothetical protein